MCLDSQLEYELLKEVACLTFRKAPEMGIFDILLPIIELQLQCASTFKKGLIKMQTLCCFQ